MFLDEPCDVASLRANVIASVKTAGLGAMQEVCKTPDGFGAEGGLATTFTRSTVSPERRRSLPHLFTAAMAAQKSSAA